MLAPTLRPSHFARARATMVLGAGLALWATTARADGPDPADVVYIHHDAGGNALAMTDGGGAVLWRAELRPFGTGTSTPAERPLVFAGQPRQPDLGFEGGLYLLGDRALDPSTGRFLSPDPDSLGQVHETEPQRWNRYAYGLDNPNRYADRSGLTPNLIQRYQTALTEIAGRINDREVATLATTLGRTKIDTVRKLDTLVNAVQANRVSTEAFKDILRNAHSQKIFENPSLKGLSRQNDTVFELRIAVKGVGKIAGKAGVILGAVGLATGALALAEGKYAEAAETFSDQVPNPIDPLGINSQANGDLYRLVPQADPWYGPKQALKWLTRGELGDQLAKFVGADQPDE